MTITISGEECIDSLTAASKLGVHPSGLTRLAKKLRGTKIHGWLFPVAELDKLVQERKAQKTNAQS